MKTKEDAVDLGVKAQALIDKHLTAARKAANQYADAIETAIETGMFSSRLEAKRMLAEARALPGKIAECAQAAADLHISGTALAVANGVDLGTVATVGGIAWPEPAEGEMTTFGGGGR